MRFGLVAFWTLTKRPYTARAKHEFGALYFDTPDLSSVRRKGRIAAGRSSLPVWRSDEPVIVPISWLTCRDGR